MSSIDSGALGPVRDQLKATDMAQSAVFRDEELIQTFDTVAAVRRGRADVGTQGIFYGIFENSHAIAGQLTTSIDPYAVPLANRVGSFPSPIDRDEFDLWLIAATSVTTAGAGNLNSAALAVNFNGRMQAFGIDDTGAAVVATSTGPSAQWDLEATTALGTSHVTAIAAFTPAINGRQKIMRRIPRGASLVYGTDAAAAATYRCNVELALFPAGLGQDVGL